MRYRGLFFVLAGLALAAPGRFAAAQQPVVPTPASQRLESWQLHKEMAENSRWNQLQWQPVGPRLQGGRVESIAVSPHNRSVIYAGVGSGGIWKSENHGVSWNPVFQSQPTCAIGDIALSPTDPELVWVGTGEVLMARSALCGIGVFKSLDAGQTWQHMGLPDTHHIARVLIHPDDSNIVYVAAIGHRSTPNQERGVYKTDDGGRSWQQVLFVDDRTAAIDLVFEPGNPEILYTTMWTRIDSRDPSSKSGSGIYKSTNAGHTWEKLAGGLPESDQVGRIGIDVAATDPQVVYAIADTGRNDQLFRSSDGGQSWEMVNDQLKMIRWDWCEVRVSPDNENEIYNIGQKSYRSTDGGRSFDQIEGTIVHMLPHGSDILHLDTHCMWIDPTDTNRIWFGNDGGLFLTFDRCKTWLHINTLPIAECYAVTYDMQRPYNIYIGTQDNAALFGPSDHRPRTGGRAGWQQVYLDPWGGGDSYFTYRDPSDFDTIYYEHQFGDLRRKNMVTGKTDAIRPRIDDEESELRFAWMTPFMPSAHEPRTLYYAANHVFKSVNRGDDWQLISPDLAAADPPPNTRYRAVTTLAESPLVPGRLFAGTDTGQVHRTDDDGQSWNSISDGLPRLNVTKVFTSPHNAETVFVSLNGLSNDDFRPFLYRSDDRGETWQAISHGLPLEPVNVVIEDPKVRNVLYIGTELGVYVSLDGGQTWESLCHSLPTTSVYDMFVHPRDHELVIGTHGLSVFLLDVSPIHSAAAE